MQRVYVTSEKQSKEPLICHEPTSRSWEKVATDIIHTWWQELSVHSNYYSGYFEVDQLHGKTGTVVIKKLKKHFVTHWTSNELLSGNDPPFNSAEFENFLRSSGTAYVTSSPGYPQSNGRVENAVKTAKSLIKKVQAMGADYFLLLLSWRNTPTEGLSTSPAWRMFGQHMQTHLQGALAIGERQDSQTNATSHEKSQTWFKAEIEELADVRSYKVKTEDGRILRRNRRHLCRSREPFYSSQPSEAPVALQPLDMAASPEKLQGPQPTEGQSFPTVPAQGNQSKQPTKTPVAIPSKAQPLCTTLNKSRPVENRITRAGRLSKPPGYLKDYAWLHLMIVRDG